MAPNKRKTRKTTKILLIISGIFGLFIIAGAIYFYMLKDSTPTDTDDDQTYCGCYYLDPLVSNACGDPRLGFNFNIASGESAQSCVPDCNTDSLNTSYLNSSTEQSDYQVCFIQNIADHRCTQLSIVDDDGQIITGKVNKEDTIKVTATFDDVYTNYTFYINNEPVDADTVSVDQKSIEKTILVADYLDASSLEIKASAKDSLEETINSESCHRLIDIIGEGEVNVSRLAFETSSDSDGIGYIFETALIDVGNLTDSGEISVLFAFDRTSIPDLTMTDGLSVNASSGRITIQEADLYMSSNFEEESSFEILSNITGDLLVTAEVFDGTESLGSVETTVEIPIPEDEDDQTDTQDNDTDDDTDTTDPTDITDTTSSFTVTKSSSPTCVERVEGSNTATFTITISNNQDISDDISSILDKLPLGFTYVSDSSTINGQSVEDTTYVTTEVIGNSQEITWEAENGWSVPAGSAIEISFDTIAGDNAITGENQNEVVVTPVNTPDDPTTLRAETVIQVAQDCDAIDTTPDTGIFDISIVKIIVGLMIISTGYFIYNSPRGMELAEAVTETNSYRSFRKASLRIFNPKEYFETKILEKIDRKKKMKD